MQAALVDTSGGFGCGSPACYPAANFGGIVPILDANARGVFVISVTPFTITGAIDSASTDRLTDFYLSCRVHGITLLGMMGEASTLTSEEALAFVRQVLHRVDGRVPVVVGVPSGGLAPMAALARSAMDLGAAGVLVAPMAGLRTDQQVHRFYAQACDALGPDTPVVYQDYPQATGVSLSISTFLCIVADLPQVVVIKHEDCPGLGKISAIRAQAAAQVVRRVSILAGNGGLYFPLELWRGADGAMTGFAYPDMLVDVYERFVSGHAEEAEDVFDDFLPLVRYEQQPGFGLAVRKEILRRRGAIACAATRVPGPALDQADRDELDRLIARLERRRKGH